MQNDLQSLYAAAKQTIVYLSAKRDNEGLSGQEGNILDTLYNLIEYIENIKNDTA